MAKPKNVPWHALDQIIERSRVKLDNEEEGIRFVVPRGLSVAEQVKTDAVLEYWVQQYVFSNPEQVSLKELEGPFETGPDFKAKVRGFKGKVDVEVEVRCENYVKHGHPEDARWSDVKVLIVLEKDKPDKVLRKKLPKRIVHIDKEHFTGWYREAARAYALKKEPENALNRNLARVRLIANRVHHNWLEVCADKERDMATCPHCNLCPYFGEGTAGEATEVFDSLALRFLQERGTPKKLNIGKIAQEEVDAFCRRTFRGE
jgi:hypothetical protein